MQFKDFFCGVFLIDEKFLFGKFSKYITFLWLFICSSSTLTIFSINRPATQSCLCRLIHRSQHISKFWSIAEPWTHFPLSTNRLVSHDVMLWKPFHHRTMQPDGVSAGSFISEPIDCPAETFLSPSRLMLGWYFKLGRDRSFLRSLTCL